MGPDQLGDQLGERVDHRGVELAASLAPQLGHGLLPTPDDLDRAVRLSLLLGAATATLITLIRR